MSFPELLEKRRHFLWYFEKRQSDGNDKRVNMMMVIGVIVGRILNVVI